MKKSLWCEGGMQMEDTGTNNYREDKLNPRLGYAMVLTDNWQNTCKKGVTWYIRI